MISIYLYKRYRTLTGYGVKKYEFSMGDIERLVNGYNTQYPYSLGNDLTNTLYDVQEGDLSLIEKTDTDERKSYSITEYFFYTKDDALKVNTNSKHIKITYSNINQHFASFEEGIFSHYSSIQYNLMNGSQSIAISTSLNSSTTMVNINDIDINKVNISEFVNMYFLLEPRGITIEERDSITGIGISALNYGPQPTVLYIKFSSKNSTTLKYVKDILEIATPLETPYDPSDIDDGNGDYDNDSDDIEFPDLPVSNVFASGLVTGYILDNVQLNSLSNYLWSTDFIDNIPKLFSEPFNAIIGLQLFPYAISGTPTNITIGGIDTGIASNKLNNQYITINYGKLTCENYFGSALDYPPYSKISIYLPYIGVQGLNVNDIMGSELELIYNIDLLSMSCVALLKCERNRNGTNLNSVLYHWNGNLGTQIPITGQSFSEIYKTLLGTITTIGLSASTGGSTLALSSMALGNALNSNVNVQRSNSIGSTYGLMSVQKPYLIIERPIHQTPKNYLEEYGSPSNVTKKISELSGYTEIDSIHLDDVNLTYDEKNELMRLLNNGVVF